MGTGFQPKYVVDKEGKRQAVLLSMAEYQELVEAAQDVLDAEEISRLRDEPLIPWGEVKAERESGKGE